MKQIILAGAFLVGLHGNAFAQSVCNGSTVQDAGAFISGKQICASDNGERWQEYHQSGGALIDYKLGNNTVDPTTQVGNWSATGRNLTHIYGSLSYTYVLQPNSNPNQLCNTSTGKTYAITILASGPQQCP